MSIFSAIGKAVGGLAKGVAKIGLNVAGGVIGDNHLGNDLFGSSGAAAPVVQQAAPIGYSYNPYAIQSAGLSGVGVYQQTPSIIDQLKGMLQVASGNKPILTQVESSAIPPWLFPVGLVLAGLIALKMIFSKN